MRQTILFFLAIMVHLTVFAQLGEKRLALVIGNSEYKNGGILKNPVNDANLMANTLSDLGFEVIKITNADLQQMQNAAVEFTDKIKNYDIALFYFAGHGVQVNGINYLIPVDAALNEMIRTKYEAFDISDINYAFSQNNGKLNLMILDACRDNPFRSWMRGGDRGFKVVSNQATGTLIAFATREGETASDGSGNNGLYTEKLVEQMKIPQNITDVFMNTRIKVLQASNNTQCPQEWNMLTSNFSFINKVVNPEENKGYKFRWRSKTDSGEWGDWKNVVFLDSYAQSIELWSGSHAGKVMYKIDIDSEGMFTGLITWENSLHKLRSSTNYKKGFSTSEVNLRVEYPGEVTYPATFYLSVERIK